MTREGRHYRSATMQGLAACATAVALAACGSNEVNSFPLSGPSGSSSAPACHSPQLQGSRHLLDVASTITWFRISLMNTGTSICQLSGSPEIALVGSNGSPFTMVNQTPVGSTSTLDVGPNSSAYFALGMETCGPANGARTSSEPVTLAITLPADVVRLPWTLSSTCKPALAVSVSGLVASPMTAGPGFPTGGSPPQSMPPVSEPASGGSGVGASGQVSGTS